MSTGEVRAAIHCLQNSLGLFAGEFREALETVIRTAKQAEHSSFIAEQLRLTADKIDSYVKEPKAKE